MTYSHQAPPLHVVTFRIEMAEDPVDESIVTRAFGESNYRRQRLWTETNTFNVHDDDLRHAPADWMHHIALTALQDRPNTPERLVFGLTGGLGYQGAFDV